jgi:hypothetical protein
MSDAMHEAVPTPTPIIKLLSVGINSDWSISLEVSVWVTAGLLVIVAGCIACRLFCGRSGWKNFEINEAEIGIGSGKMTLKPNLTDRQVAYSLWVELSTRKIGLPIDFEHDVIVEIYNSWHDFFSITRDLVKSIPVNKVRQDSTGKIIKLSIEVLNQGLRPHLTKWQARFRHWYEKELNNASGDIVIDPQSIQQKFPKWDELKKDMGQVNERLMHYREKMRLLVLDR